MLNISAITNIIPQYRLQDKQVFCSAAIGFKSLNKDLFQSTIPTITKISRKDFKKIYPIYLKYRESANVTSTIAEVKKFLSEESKRTGDEIFTANIAGKTVGFLHFGKEYSTLSGNVRYRMKALFVDENHRGKGISKKLIEAMQEFAGNKEIIVKARRTNEISPHLYPKTGFHEDQEYVHFVYKNLNKSV